MIKPWDNLFNHNCLSCNECTRESIRLKNCPCRECYFNLEECAKKSNCKTWSRGFGL